MINNDVFYTCMFIAGLVKKKAFIFHLLFSSAIYFFFHLVVEVCHSPHPPSKHARFLHLVEGLRRLSIAKSSGIFLLNDIFYH